MVPKNKINWALIICLLISIMHMTPTIKSQCQYEYVGRIPIVEDQVIGTIQLNQILELSFDFKINVPCSGFCHIFAIGNKNPLIFTKSSKLFARWQTNTEMTGFSLDTRLAAFQAISDDNYHNLFFRWSFTERMLFIDGVEYENIQNLSYDHSNYMNELSITAVWANPSGNQYPYNGEIKNLCINTFPILPRGDSHMAVGLYNGSIFLMGGYTYEQQLVQYDIATNNFTDYGEFVLSNNTWGVGQYYTQLNNTLYMINPEHPTFCTFNMETTTFISSWSNIIIPIYIGPWSCLAANKQYLFVVGGFGDENLQQLQVLDIAWKTWLNNVSDMLYNREKHSCIVATTTNILYAIGGYNPFGSSTLSSVESININNITQQSWQYVGALTEPASRTRAVLWHHLIFVIGGYAVDNMNNDLHRDTIHIIDTINGTISLSNHKLLYRVHSMSPIITNNILWIFGGVGNTDSLNVWMKYELSQIVSSQSEEPSNGPTSNPVTNAPTSTAITTEPTTSFPITDVPTSNSRTFEPTTNLPTTVQSLTNDTSTDTNNRTKDFNDWWVYVLCSILFLICTAVILYGICKKLKNGRKSYEYDDAERKHMTEIGLAEKKGGNNNETDMENAKGRLNDSI